MEWQPIETAPKNGTWVLVTGGYIDYCWEGETQPDVTAAQYVINIGWQMAWYDSGYYGGYKSPTHWMPLPKPPINESVK